MHLPTNPPTTPPVTVMTIQGAIELLNDMVAQIAAIKMALAASERQLARGQVVVLQICQGANPPDRFAVVTELTDKELAIAIERTLLAEADKMGFAGVETLLTSLVDRGLVRRLPENTDDPLSIAVDFDKMCVSIGELEDV